MNITPLSKAIHVEKTEGTAVDYFLFPEFEIHYNEVKPGVVQLWHHHPQIWETLFMIEGELEAHWLDENQAKHMTVVRKGNVIEVENQPHTFINTSDSMAKFVVFRFVPTGEDKSQLIKNDKTLDEHLQ